MYGAFSALSLEPAALAGFARECSGVAIVPSGLHRVVIGFAFKSHQRLIQFDVRPMNERYGLKWTDIEKPWPVSIKRMTVEQIEWHRRSVLAFQTWYDGEGPDGPGMACYFATGVPILPEAHAVWVGLELESRGPWRGVLSIRARVADGPPLFLRLPLRVEAA
jgi:hypothetical protein